MKILYLQIVSVLRKILLPLLLVGVVSCIKNPDAGEHTAPEILGVSADVEGTDVILSCKVSRSDNISGCGFFFGLGEDDMDSFETELPQDGEFTLQIPGLTFGVRYYCRSYIRGGDAAAESDLKSFEIAQRLPGIEFLPVTVKSRASVICEYSVTESFSGEMYVCGICYGKESHPVIEGAKTVDSAEYGTHRVEINGLETGQTYYFRPYAINGKGTAYGEEQSLRMPVMMDDPALQSYLISAWDSDSDGLLSVEEAAAVTGIDLCTDDVRTLTGIEQLSNLHSLRCAGTGTGGSGRSGSGGLTEANLGGCPLLSFIDLSCNQLTSFTIGSSAETVNLSSNPLGSLSLPQDNALRSLNLSYTGLSSLDYARLESLEELHIGGSALSADDIINKLRGLLRFYAGDKLRNGVKVYLLSGLELLDCEGSPVSALDLRYNSALASLNANGCSMESLDLNLNPLLKSLRCMCESLKTLYLLEGQEIDGINKGGRLYIPLSTQIIYTPKIADAEFSRYLVDKFDTDYDSFVSLAEASIVSEINIDNGEYSGISSLYGVQMFTSLERLYVPGQALTSLELGSNPALKLLCCDSNPLKSLDLSGNTELETLYCQSTPLETIDLSQNVRLEAAYLSRCGLKTLDVSSCTSLGTLDVSNNPELKQIIVSRSQNISITKDDTAEIVYND